MDIQGTADWDIQDTAELVDIQGTVESAAIRVIQGTAEVDIQGTAEVGIQDTADWDIRDTQELAVTVE